MLALLLLLSALVPVPDEAAELVAEFRRYYGKDRSPEERREAVLTLKGIDSLEGAKVLMAPLEDEEFLVRRAAVETLGVMRRLDVATWLAIDVLEDRKLKKNEVLVAGVVEALGSMGHGLAREPLEALVTDRRLVVRLGAIAGLGSLGDEASIPVLTQQMADSEPAILIACLDALSVIDGGEASASAVDRGLKHPDKTVRLAAVRAVQSLRLKSGLRPLMEMLDGDLDPRVSEDAYDVVLLLTQRKYPDQTQPWINWWDRTESRFTMPDLEAIMAAKERIAVEGGRYARGGKTFQGIETKSENIIFVVDVSKSMEESFGNPERLAATGRTYDSLQRLAIVKEELINTVDSLEDTTVFNIVAFASDVESWKRRPAKASILNRNNAKSWVGDLEPKGGGGAGFRARLGFSAEEASEGQTNTHLALMTAFGEEVGGKKKGGKSFVTKSTSAVDTIFFLTDGEPTVGETVDMAEIREEVRRVNAYRGVQLHVIYVGAYGGTDFRKLAEENGGVFVAVGG
jgi:hypothetical protein